MMHPDQRTNTLAARLPPRGDSIEFRPMLPIVSTEQGVDEVVGSASVRHQRAPGSRCYQYRATASRIQVLNEPAFPYGNCP
jgi:hypothetical protein